MNRKIQGILKKMLWIIAILSAIILLLFIIEYNSKEYLVRIDFCNDRESVTIKVKALSEPGNGDINTYKEAVPRYKGYLNVCNVTTLTQL